MDLGLVVFGSKLAPKHEIKSIEDLICFAGGIDWFTMRDPQCPSTRLGYS